MQYHIIKIPQEIYISSSILETLSDNKYAYIIDNIIIKFRFLYDIETLKQLAVISDINTFHKNIILWFEKNAYISHKEKTIELYKKYFFEDLCSEELDYIKAVIMDNNCYYNKNNKWHIKK